MASEHLCPPLETHLPVQAGQVSYKYYPEDLAAIDQALRTTSVLVDAVVKIMHLRKFPSSHVRKALIRIKLS